MITAITGPLIVEPVMWNLVFARQARSWQQNLLVIGKYKHVRAYAYVPFLHVWVFFDPHLRGTSIVLAAAGEPAQRMIAAWIENGDVVRMPRQCNRMSWPFLGFCVPAIKRLMGLRCGALRPDALYRHCLRHGGAPFEEAHGRHPVRSAVSATGA